MKSVTSDTRIQSVSAMRSPADLASAVPLGVSEAQAIADTRQRISQLLEGKDQRLLIVVGPCSIHDPAAAREYASRLKPLRDELAESLEIVMRVYFEKPRTTVGWKGLINDPGLDGSFNIDGGLEQARRLLVHLAELGLPAGCEFLDAVTGQYYADTVSWGAIGARTTESQVHREIASGLSCPVGFKNGTGGDVGIAIDAIQAAGHPHAFLSPTEQGKVALYRTLGNEDAHLILRGGREPNFDADSIASAVQAQRQASISRRIMVDCSHANSGKDHRRQSAVAGNVVAQVNAGNRDIGGLMIESHLIEGKQGIGTPQSRIYGMSITDACIGWQETDALLRDLAKAVLRD